MDTHAHPAHSMSLCLPLLLALLYLSANVCTGKVCSIQDVVDHLNLTTNRDRLSWMRPVQDWTTPTVVYLDILIYTILSVQNEKSQMFMPYLWVMTSWKNNLISWDPEDFCGIQQIIVPRDLLWKPDLLIYENLEMDKVTVNDLVIKYDGTVVMDKNLKVLSTCAMDIHKFPFDIQQCNLTFSSAIHTDKEIQLVPESNSTRATKNSQEVLVSLGEWEFLNVSVHTVKMSFQEHGTWDQVIYSITIKRAPLLQVLTFILPVLFLLALDLASFFMSEARGDKLAFKVTVLLAMSVLLLVLTDTLPSKSSRTPLIAVYVTVVFAFMLLSVLETILVVYLMERASSAPQRTRPAKDGICSRPPSLQGLHLSNDTEKRMSVSGCMCGVDGVHGLRELETLPMAPDSSERNSEGHEGRCVGHLLRLILQELRKDPQNPALDHVQACYQNMVIRPINTIYFLLYLLSLSVFLLFLFLDWVYW